MPPLGWDSSPFTSARISAELWAQIKNEDWSLVGNDAFFGRWPTRLWNFEKHYQFIGGSGGEGVGYGARPRWARRSPIKSTGA